MAQGISAEPSDSSPFVRLELLLCLGATANQKLIAVLRSIFGMFFFSDAPGAPSSSVTSSGASSSHLEDVGTSSGRLRLTGANLGDHGAAILARALSCVARFGKYVNLFVLSTLFPPLPPFIFLVCVCFFRITLFLSSMQFVLERESHQSNFYFFYLS